jgi:hypothetical protein
MRPSTRQTGARIGAGAGRGRAYGTVRTVIAEGSAGHRIRHVKYRSSGYLHHLQYVTGVDGPRLGPSVEGPSNGIPLISVLPPRPRGRPPGPPPAAGCGWPRGGHRPAHDCPAHARSAVRSGVRAAGDPRRTHDAHTLPTANDRRAVQLRTRVRSYRAAGRTGRRRSSPTTLLGARGGRKCSTTCSKDKEGVRAFALTPCLATWS